MAPRKRSSRRRARTPRVPRSVRTAFNGVVPKGRPDPPSVTQKPWNSIVLEDNNMVDHDTLIVYRYTALIDFLTTQTNIATTAPDIFEFRISRVDLWNLSGGTIAGSFGDLLNLTTDSPIANLQDSPGRNHWSHVHYVWPRSHQNQVLNGSPSAVYFSVRTGVSDTEPQDVRCHVHVLWRASGLAEPLLRLDRVPHDENAVIPS